MTAYLEIRPEVAAALAQGRPVVALESAIIAHGLPWPDNLRCADKLEAIVREQGVTPATIGLSAGRIHIGLDQAQRQRFARANDIAKVSRRDLAAVLAGGGDGATTVAATMLCAYWAGIRVFATGGIGGVHRGADASDVSADLYELGRTPVAVVCAGAKSILDLPKTLEVLETLGVPVLGYGCDAFPAFYLRSSGLPVSRRIDGAAAAARAIAIQRDLGLGGTVIAAPIPRAHALAEREVESWIEQAQAQADAVGVSGRDSTPFLLARIVELSAGRALQANLALVENNARIAAQIASELHSL